MSKCYFPQRVSSSFCITVSHCCDSGDSNAFSNIISSSGSRISTERRAEAVVDIIVDWLRVILGVTPLVVEVTGTEGIRGIA